MNHSFVTKFLSSYKKPLLWGILVCIVFLSVWETVFAVDAEGWSGDGASMFFDVLNGGLKIMASFLWVLTAFVSLFLNPEWTSGTLFWLNKHLKEIWILVSNVVYFLFALILVAIAFMNIVWKGEGNTWELKQALPRFIIGVLIVPFSWFFVQFVLSVSAILTIGVLTLPYDTFKEEDFLKNIDSDFEICTHQVIDLWSGNASNGSNALSGGLECKDKKTIQQILWEPGESGLKNGIFGIISIYTYGILGVNDKDKTERPQLNSIKDLIDLWVKWIFDILFFVVYCILMVALFLALLVRWIWLWMYMMISPVFGLLYFFNNKEWVWSDNTKFSIKEFISLALVPVYVSAALSFGLVFLFVASNGLSKEIESGDGGEQTLSLGGFSLTIHWYQWKTNNPLWIKGALSTLIVELFGIVILWIAVMAALKQSDTTANIVKPIAEFGSNVWSMVKSAPMYAPIIPTGSGWLSATWLNQIWGTASQYVSNQSRKTGDTFMQNRQLFWQTSDQAAKSSELLEAVKNPAFGVGSPKTFDLLKRSLDSHDNLTNLSNDAKFVDAIKELWKQLWLGENLYKNLEPWNKQGVSKLVWEIDHKLDTDSKLKTYNVDLLENISKRWDQIKTTDIDNYFKNKSRDTDSSKDQTDTSWVKTVKLDGGIDISINPSDKSLQGESHKSLAQHIANNKLDKNAINTLLKGKGVSYSDDDAKKIAKFLKKEGGKITFVNEWWDLNHTEII